MKRNQVIVRYWQHKFLLGSKQVDHISLEIPSENAYFSFYPNFVQDDKSGRAKVSADNPVYKGGFSSKENDLKLGVTREIILVLKNTNRISDTIKILKSREDLSWQMWSVADQNGFNSATGVLLLLRIGDLYEDLEQKKIEKIYPNVTRALFGELLSNLSAFDSFFKETNHYLSPEIVFDLAVIAYQNQQAVYNCSTCCSFWSNSQARSSDLESQSSCALQ